MSKFNKQVRSSTRHIMLRFLQKPFHSGKKIREWNWRSTKNGSLIRKNYFVKEGEKNEGKNKHKEWEFHEQCYFIFIWNSKTVTMKNIKIIWLSGNYVIASYGKESKSKKNPWYGFWQSSGGTNKLPLCFYFHVFSKKNNLIH